MPRRNRAERDALRRCSGHPCVVQLIAAFGTPAFESVATEYCGGGTLRTVLAAFPRTRMAEAQARFYMAELLLGALAARPEIFRVSVI